MSVHTTIIRNITTEKSSNEQISKRYTFEVNRKATKVDVKKAVKEIYGAEVEKVTMMIVPPKKRMVQRGRLWTKRPIMKKAIIRLKEKASIDPSKLNKSKDEKKTKSTKPKKVAKK